MEENFLALHRQVESSKELRTCIETLVKIFGNTVRNPNDGKFRTLRTTNAKFLKSVWKFDACQQMMKHCGWILEGENIVLPPGEDLTVPLYFLIENREVKPSANEWVSETKHIIPNADNEKERSLRQEALAKKEKEMIELLKDMDERKTITADILAEHRDDQQKRKVPVGGSSRYFDQPAPAPNGSTVAQPRRISTSNVLGGSTDPNSSIDTTGTVAHATAHRHAPAFPRPSHYQQPSGSSHYPGHAGPGHHAASRTAQRPFGQSGDDAPLRLNRGAGGSRRVGGYDNDEEDRYHDRDEDDYDERNY